MTQRLTPAQKDKLALELIELLQKEGAFEECMIYTNNKAYSPDSFDNLSETKAQTSLGSYFVVPFSNDKVKLKDEYANTETLTMTFEGILYDMIYNDMGICDKLNKLFKKYHMYYEQGYSWSFSCYFIN